MATKITREVLESHLRCKTKAFLKLAGQQGQVSDYESLLVADRHEVRRQAIERLLAKHPEGEVARDLPLTTATLQTGPLIVLDATLDDEWLSLVFDGLKRVDGSSKLGDFHYIPMLFHEGRKVGKEQRLLLNILGLLLSPIQGRLPADGLVCHGPDGKTTKVRLSPAIRTTERALREVKEIAKAGSPPTLILNDHCQVCEFRQRCHEQAVREDSISLLRGISENEVKHFARKGLFTVTQLAHTFRPRRKGTRKGPGSQKHHHALQAMAVRDKTVYVFGTPQLPSKPGSDLRGHGGRPRRELRLPHRDDRRPGRDGNQALVLGGQQGAGDPDLRGVLGGGRQVRGCVGVLLRSLRAGLPQADAEAGEAESV